MSSQEDQDGPRFSEAVGMKKGLVHKMRLETTKGINKFAADCAPVPVKEVVFEHDEENPSSLDDYSFRWKAFVVFFVALAELTAYIVLMVYYNLHCEASMAAMTCFEATDRYWTADDDDGTLSSVINIEGVTWVSCYDTTGASGQISLSQARADAKAYGRSDDGYESTEICAVARDRNNAYALWDDDRYYQPTKCCNGYFYDDASCAPDDHCFNDLMTCYWERCPTFMEAWSLANGAFAGIHVLFYQVVVCLVLWAMTKYCKVQKKEKADDEVCADVETTEMEELHAGKISNLETFAGVMENNIRMLRAELVAERAAREQAEKAAAERVGKLMQVLIKDTEDHAQTTDDAMVNVSEVNALMAEPSEHIE